MIKRSLEGLGHENKSKTLSDFSVAYLTFKIRFQYIYIYIL